MKSEKDTIIDILENVIIKYHNVLDKNIIVAPLLKHDMLNYTNTNYLNILKNCINLYNIIYPYYDYDKILHLINL